MKSLILSLILFFTITQIMHAQEHKKTLISKQQLESLTEFELVNHVFQDIFDLAYSADTRHRLNAKQLAIFHISVISGEVSNGGFVQLFLNSGDEFIEGGLNAFELVGEEELSRIFREAVAVYRDNVEWFDRYDEPDFDIETERFQEVDNLEQLDDRFFDASEGLDKKLELFIKSNSEDFFTVK